MADADAELLLVCQFLEKRGVDQKTVQTFRENKMDKKAISCASKDTLKELGLTAMGDIISVRAFCDTNERNQEFGKLPSTTSTQSLEGINERKRSLLQILEKGKSSRLNKGKPGKQSKMDETTKKVHIGWLHQDRPSCKHKQIRLKQGGGVREPIIPISYSREQVINTAVALFFPGGNSSYGHQDDMDIGLATFQCTPIESTITTSSGEVVPFTVQNYGSNTGCTRIKMYLTTCKKVENKNEKTIVEIGDDDENDDHEGECDYAMELDDYESDNDLMKSYLMNETDDRCVETDLIGSSQERKALKNQQNKAYEEALKKDIEKELAKQKKIKDEKFAQDKLEEINRLKNASKERTPAEPDISDPHVEIRVNHVNDGLIKRRFPPNENMSAVYDWITSIKTSPQHFYLKNFSNQIFLPAMSLELARNETLYMADKDPEVQLDDSDDEVSIKDYSLIHLVPKTSEKLPDQLMVDDPIASDENESEYPRQNTEPHNIDDTSPPRSDEERGRYFRTVQLPQLLKSPQNEKAQIEQERMKLLQDLENLESPKVVEIERWNVVTSLMELYRNNDTVLDSVLQFKFKDELGCDFGGLSREVYSLFFKECSMKFFEGNANSFVPRHSGISKDDLNTIGKIIHHSFVLTGIFPVSLNRAYIQAMLRNEEELPEELLLQCYIEYLDSYEGQKLEAILRCTRLEEEARDFITDLEDRVGMTTYPDSPATARKIFLEIASSELLQLPLHTMAKVKRGMVACDQGKHLWQNISAKRIEAIYSAQAPEPSKVASLLTTQKDQPTKEEAKMFNHLRRYVYATDQKMCEAFLRYCTASTNIVVDKIAVSFFKPVSVQPLPKAHTCGAVLELPSSGYPTYNFFKNTMDSLLENPLAYHFKFA